MAIAFNVGSPSYSRSGNTVTISIPISAINSNNTAYRLQVKVNDQIWQTSAVNGNISGTYSRSIASPGSLSETFIIQLYQQETQPSPFTFVQEIVKVVAAPPASYTVTFDPNGGTIETSTKVVYYSNTYGELPDPARDLYRFVGWYTEADGGDRITEESYVQVVDNQTLYAHWRSLVGGYTSLTIDQETMKMSMPRGDSEAIIVKSKDEPFVAGDKIEFSIRRKPKSERLVHITVTEFEEDEDGAAYIEIAPEDTHSLDFGNYVYDIQLTKASGWVTTIVETSEFELKTEVTYND